MCACVSVSMWTVAKRISNRKVELQSFGGPGKQVASVLVFEYPVNMNSFTNGHLGFIADHINILNKIYPNPS